MICILARDRKPEYYEKLKTVLDYGMNHLQNEARCCDIMDCDVCENCDICKDLTKAILFLEEEQLRAEMKAQKKLPK